MPRAVGPGHLKLHIVVSSARHRFLKRVIHAGAVLRQDVGEKGLVTPLGNRFGVAETLVMAQRAAGHVRAQIHIPVADAGRREGKAQPLLALAHQPLRPFARRDVLHRAVEPHHDAARVLAGQRHRLHLHLLAVGPQDRELILLGFARLDCASDLFRHQSGARGLVKSRGLLEGAWRTQGRIAPENLEDLR